MGILLALSVVFGAVGFLAFRWCDRRARERGMIDMTTNY